MTVFVGSTVRTSMGCGVVAETRQDGITCVNLRASNTNEVYQGFFSMDSITPIGGGAVRTTWFDYEKGQRRIFFFC